MLRRLLLAALAVAATVVQLRAELTLQPPAAPITAGAEFELGLLVTNPAGEPLAVPALHQLPLVARAGTRAFSVVFLPAAATTDTTPLAPGAFRKLVFRGRLPAELTGLVLLDAATAGAARAAVEIVPPEPGVAPASAQSVATAEPIAPVEPARREFGLSPHEPIYFSVGDNGGLNARFQLSFKFRPIGPSDDRIAGRGFWEEFYLAFTQTSLWDLHSLSKPFTDSSYRPSLFYYRYDTGASFLGATLGFASGFEHESNGKAGDDSRSINILFARPTLRWGADNGWQFVASPKLYWYIDKEENSDIQRFRGYGDFLFSFGHPDSLKIATTLRAGTSGRGSILIDASYPFAKVNDLFPLGWVHGYLHFQFFNGWGESILRYDEQAETQFRVGFMALR